MRPPSCTQHWAGKQSNRRPSVLLGATQRKRATPQQQGPPPSTAAGPKRRASGGGGGGGGSRGGGGGGRAGGGSSTRGSAPPASVVAPAPAPPAPSAAPTLSSRPLHLTLAKDLGRSLLAGAPWVYRDALSPQSRAALARGCAPGQLALVKDGRDGSTILAKGYADPASPIAFRALATRERLDEGLVLERLRRCTALRRALLPPDGRVTAAAAAAGGGKAKAKAPIETRTTTITTGYRLVNGEGDGLPGLHVDVYGDVAVVKLDGAGAEAFYLGGGGGQGGGVLPAWLSDPASRAGAGDVLAGGGACRGPVRTVYLKYRRGRGGGGGGGGSAGAAAAAGAAGGGQGDDDFDEEEEQEDEDEDGDEDQDGSSASSSADRGRTLFGPAPSSAEPVPFFEHGVRFTADVVRGQKTGFFLDQRDNRIRLRAFCGGAEGASSTGGGKRVLNLFAYTGGFSMHAGAAGAARVTSVDVSAGACAAAEAHWRDPANGLDPAAHEAVRADVFDFLEDARSGGETWDVVVCDPPSFAPSAAAAKGAAAGAYRRVFAAAAQAVRPGGVLALASCSSHVPRDEFEVMAGDALARARRKGLCLGPTAGAGLDHPFPLAARELSYLKFGLYQLD